jgi:hypothetical protein
MFPFISFSNLFSVSESLLNDALVAIFSLTKLDNNDLEINVLR